MKITVTLTACSNEHLAPHLPLTGELHILETGINGAVTRAAFRAEYLDGTLAALVQVEDVEFSYGSAAPDYPAGRLPMPPWKASAGTGLWTEQERAANRRRQETPPRDECPYCMTSLEEHCPWH